MIIWEVRGVFAAFILSAGLFATCYFIPKVQAALDVSRVQRGMAFSISSIYES